MGFPLTNLAKGARVPDSEKIVFKTATATLTGFERVIMCDTTAGAMTITLPPAAEHIGEQIAVYITSSDANVVTVAATTGDILGPITSGNHAFEDQYDYAIYMSIGLGWLQTYIKEND